MNAVTRPERGRWFPLAIAVGTTLPGILLRFHVYEAPVAVEAVLFGATIMGAAFLLAWAAEVAQLDISQTLAIAVLAIIAVLPEYAVDLILAFRAGQGDAESTRLAVANMTGANRLLIGIGWATVVLVAWWKSRKSANPFREVVLKREQRLDVGFLLLASLWAAFIPLRKQISFLDLAILGAMFVVYIIRAAREEVEEPELVGAAAAIGALPTARRRALTLVLFLFSAAAILATAEAFAESLKELGEQFGISKFLLIQWIAPLASESPEMIIAIIFVLRFKAQAGIGTLISSKVNQWTLLVGTLPLVFSIGAGAFDALPMDARQQEEVLLTAAQSLFAVAIIANLSVSRWEALALLVLFLAQLFLPGREIRLGFAVGYLVLFVALVAWSRQVRSGLIASLRNVFLWGRPPRGG